MKKEIVVGKIKRLISVIMLLTMLVMLTSCEHWMTKKAYKTKEFLFYNNTIIELREKALEQESLVIPKYLNGQEVYGIRDIREYAVAGERKIRINCENYNLKSLYLNEFMGNEKYSTYTRIRVTNLEMLFIISNEVGISYGYVQISINSKIKFISNFLFEQLIDAVGIDGLSNYEDECHKYNANKRNLIYVDAYEEDYNQDICAANVSFMYNFESSPNYDYCFIDNTEDGKVNRPKYDPIREGYKFTGWYKDSECKEKFNFEEMIEIDTENYKENKIYAGWEEIV